jgi:hypothetical protein
MAQMTLPMFDAAADEEPGVELSAPGLTDRQEERQWLEQILLRARRAEPGESKRRTLVRFLRRAQEPAIVFTEYRDTLMRLADVLEAWRPAILHGGLTSGERRESLLSFTNGNAPLLLATDAASEGLNLQQRCRLVVNLELPWTPLRLEQRVGRVERIGQSRRVHAVYLVAAGTAEESLAVRLQARTDRAADALERAQREPEEAPPLAAIAESETVRIGRLRALAKGLTPVVHESRPVVTVMRKRKGRVGFLWAFHFSFTDAGAHIVWTALLGATTSQRNPEAPPYPIEGTASWLVSRLEDQRDAALASLRESLHAFLEPASNRERALVETLEIERARLSAALLQRGLFDRRAERGFAAQSAVLDEALLRCRTRLSEIASATEIVAGPGRLAFVLVRR